MKLFIRITCLAILSTSLLGCLPAVFTGASKTAVEMAKDRPIGDTLTDVKISARIKAALIKKSFRNIYSRVTIEVVQGRVLFTGVLEKEEHALDAIKIAWEQQGVVEVINELKIDEKSGKFNIVQYTRDTLITSQIKSKIFMNRDLKFVNYTVITIDDVVYLFGIARSEEELEKVANIAANIHGVKKVICHVKILKEAHRTRPQSNGRRGNGIFGNIIDGGEYKPEKAEKTEETSQTEEVKTLSASDDFDLGDLDKEIDNLEDW